MDWRNEFGKYCRGQPPNTFYLSPSLLATSRMRRPTLADKPELDALLEKDMVLYKGEKYLPLVPETLHNLREYLLGSKPVTQSSLAKLLFNEETNTIEVEDFHASLVQIGQCCTHLTVVAPFHAANFSNPFNRDMGSSEPGGDWEKILARLPNLSRSTTLSPITFSSIQLGSRSMPTYTSRWTANSSSDSTKTTIAVTAQRLSQWLALVWCTLMALMALMRRETIHQRKTIRRCSVWMT